jgi:hypothetical protein
MPKTEKLTLYNAYMECSRLWFWIAKNPNYDKREWPEWKNYKRKYGQEILNYCPCCDYQDLNKQTFKCSDCLPNVWNECMGDHSPFNNLHKNKKENALKIARGARLAAKIVKPLSSFRRSIR